MSTARCSTTAGSRTSRCRAVGNIKLEVETFGPDVLAGKVYTAQPRTFGGSTYQFTATFKAPVEKEK